MKRIAILHTVRSVYNSFSGQLMAAVAQPVAISEMVDEFLVTNAREKGYFPPENRRKLYLDLLSMYSGSPDAIVVTCSSLTPFASEFRSSFDVPIITIDDRMCAEAVSGGSRIAVRTVQYMPEYMRTKIIESDYARCNRLTELVDDKVMIINGDGRDLDLLTEEGIKNTEAFVALTGSAETNILACLAAKRMGVSKTVAQVENVDYISMAESMDIGCVINKKFIAASHIYQMMLDADVSNVKCLTFANADVAEFTVKAGARITRSQVKDAGLPKGATIGGLIRNGEGILVTGNTTIQENDHVVVFCLNMMIKKLEKFFN